MGNCQAADAATVVIHHPDGKMETAYWSLPATQVMVANPGHYVAVVIPVPRPRSTSDDPAGHRKPARYLKLLRPDDTLLIGHVYRLVSFEEVLREFTSKRHVRLSRLLLRQEESKPNSRDVSGAAGVQRDDGGGLVSESENSPAAVLQVQEKSEADEAQLDTELEQMVQGMRTSARSRAGAAGAGRHGQWRPALQSIAEIGTSY